MPGPIPAYRPEFPHAVVEEALRIVRQRKVAYALWQRASLVLFLHNNPNLSNVAAAEAVHLHPNAVRLWRKRWAWGDFVLHDAPRSGRPATFSPARTSRRQKRRL
jgi:hypothetical protein